MTAPLNIALFAADEVGARVAGLFAERGVRPRILVLDAKDTRGLNDRIRAGTNAERVIDSDQLLGPEGKDCLRAAALDLAILAWWPYLLKEDLIAIPRLGCLNFHPSLLPWNRGKHPNFWSLVDGTPFGVTLHFIDAGIDTGDIAFQERIETTWEDTGASLHAAGKQAIFDLFRRHFDSIVTGDIPRTPQDPAKATAHWGREIGPASRIDLDKSYSARSLLNLLRARTFPPHPAAWFADEGHTYEVRVEIRRIDDRSI